MKESTIPISEFKAKCLRLLDDVAEQGNILVITKRGRTIARVTPISVPRTTLRGSWKGIVEIKGDLVNFHDDWGENQ